MTVLAAVAESGVWGAALGGLGAMAFAGVMIAFPKMIFPSTRGIERGFQAGCFAILLWGVCAALGVFSAGAAFLGGRAYSVATQVMGYAPLTLAFVTAGGLWVSIQRDRARAKRKQREERMAVPEYVIITDNPEETMALYHAMRKMDEVTETNVFDHPQALRWQLEDHLPRMRVLAIKAWTKPRAGKVGEGLADTPVVLARDLAEEKPRCPIVLFGQRDEDLDELEGILGKRWNVFRVKITEKDWIETQLLPVMKGFLVNS